MAEIIGLHGDAPTPEGTDPDVLRLLDEARALAEREGAIAVGIALVTRKEIVHIKFCCRQNGRHHLVAACEYLKRDIIDPSGDDVVQHQG